MTTEPARRSSSVAANAVSSSSQKRRKRSGCSSSSMVRSSTARYRGPEPLPGRSAAYSISDEPLAASRAIGPIAKAILAARRDCTTPKSPQDATSTSTPSCRKAVSGSVMANTDTSPSSSKWSLVTASARRSSLDRSTYLRPGSAGRPTTGAAGGVQEREHDLSRKISSQNPWSRALGPVREGQDRTGSGRPVDEHMRPVAQLLDRHVGKSPDHFAQPSSAASSRRSANFAIATARRVGTCSVGTSTLW